MLSAGGSTLSPNNLNLLENDAFQIQNNVVAQVAAEGQGSDENSISSPPNTPVQFVDNLDEVAPMSIPVEFKPKPPAAGIADSKVTVEIIDSVAPQSAPGSSAFNTFYPAYAKYQYKLQMSSDGNPIASYGPQSLDSNPALSVWTSEGQLAPGGSSYSPSIQLHPKWPNFVQTYTPDVDQYPSANGFYSYSIMPPPQVPPLVSHFQGPFAPDKTKQEPFNVFLDPSSSSTSSSSNNNSSAMNVTTVDGKNNTGHEQQQVTMHHLSSDGELTILKVGPKEDGVDRDKNNTDGDDGDDGDDDDDVNESDTNEIETEINHRIDEDDDIDDDDSVQHSEFSDSLDSPDPKADGTKYIVLQKLPNGGAIDLENMQTYTMEDFASDIQQNNNNNNSNKTKNFSYDRPRSFKKSLDLPDGINGTSDQVGDTTLNPFTDFVLPDELLISERPPPQPEIYEPVPLSQLEDQEAMPANQDDHPVYIIYEKDLFQTQDEHETAEDLANLELFKLSSNSSAEPAVTPENKPEAGAELEQPQALTSGPSLPGNDQIGPSEIPKVVWTPLPPQDGRKQLPYPLIGPEWPSPDYKYVKKEPGVDQVSFTQPGPIKDVEPEASSPGQEPGNDADQEKNIQLLPPRLSAVLMHVNNQNRLRSLSSLASPRQSAGFSRENKVAPIFKFEGAAGDSAALGRALPQPLQGYTAPTPQSAPARASTRPTSSRSANARSISNVTPVATRIVQAQMVQGPYKYIPLHLRSATPAFNVASEPLRPQTFATTRTNPFEEVSDASAS